MKRRDSIKNIGLATLAGGAWTTPVVKSVVIPAHASGTAPVECPSIVLELLDQGEPSGNICAYRFVVLSDDVATPVTITDISDDSSVNGVGFVAVVPPTVLPAEATNSAGVEFTASALGFSQMQGECLAIPNPDNPDLYNIIITYTCEGGTPEQMRFPIGSLIPFAEDDA